MNLEKIVIVQPPILTVEFGKWLFAYPFGSFKKKYI